MQDVIQIKSTPPNRPKFTGVLKKQPEQMFKVFVHSTSVHLSYQKSPETNPPHSGITILTLGKNKKTLSGEYFTNQKTAGRIELEFLSRKNASSFADAAIIFKKMQKKKRTI